MPLKILVADDHKIMREGLCSLIEKGSGMKVIAQAENGREALRLAQEHNPDIIIMDVSMPELNGIEATRQVLSQNPYIKIIALSMHYEYRFVMEMLKAGVCGYLLKDCAFEELQTAIKTVMSGKIYLCPPIAGIVVKDIVHGASDKGNSAFSMLTSRQREVLQLMAEGKSTKEIAQLLHVSVKTVETHRQQIMSKLNIYSVAELTKYAIREGLTTLDIQPK